MNLVEKIQKIHNKEISIEESLKYYINKIENDQYNTFITKTVELAIREAKKYDSYSKDELKKMKLIGTFAAIKDVFCTKGIRTTCASKMLENFIPHYDATVVSQVKKEGSLIIGKTNMDEFSMGSGTSNSFFGNSYNPQIDKTRPNVKLSPGGSSGGSAIAVAADLCDFALGGDTGGSIKQPAALCGVVGFRPSYGTCSRYGQIAYSSSLDQAGVLAKNLLDAALVMENISGNDPKDQSMSHNLNLSLVDEILKIENLKGLKIAIPKIEGLKIDPVVDYFWKEVASYLEKSGAIVEYCKIKFLTECVPVYYMITTTEAASNLAKFDGIRYGYRSQNYTSLDEMYKNTRTEGFGSEVKRRVLIGTYADLDSKDEKDKLNEYQKAIKIKQYMKHEFNAVFSKFDAILMPVTTSPGFSLEDKKSPEEMWMNDVFTIPPNIAGLGGLSVPCGFDSTTGLKISMQVISNAFEDLKMFQVGKFIENYFIIQNK